MLALSSAPVGGILDPLIKSITSTAVTSATSAAQPLLDDVERRLKSAILPLIALTAGSLLIGLLTYREVRRK